MTQLEWWEQLGRFWERSTGGGDVAARPAVESGGAEWPAVPRAAGVDEACDWIKRGLESADIPRFVFLVGGPGAGKSHAAAEVVRGLTPLDPQSALAQRTYEFAATDSTLILVNDATISSDKYKSAPMVHEVNEAIGKGSHFLACINRGVIVEELAQLRRTSEPPEDTAGTRILQWLHASHGDQGDFSTRSGWSIDRAVDHSYVRSGVLNNGDHEVAELLVVFVDVNSLFESAPNVSIGKNDVSDVVAGEYSVVALEKRRGLESTFSPAGLLFAEVIGAQVAPAIEYEYGRFDPFMANLQTLKNESVRRGVISVLRASEIASGQRMTFREVWGALSRCIIGGAHVELQATELEGVLQRYAPRDSDTDREKFAKLRKLAEYRFSQALYGSGSLSSEVERDPVLRLLHLVDPVRDATPGELFVGDDFGWASSVADAFSGGVGSASPLKTLLESAGSDSALAVGVTNFDRELDAAYAAMLADMGVPLSDPEREEATQWYGSYVTRLFATINGIPAFRREIQAWTVAWALSPGIPDLLEDQLTTLLKPRRYPERNAGVPLFPVFESRTNPIRGDVAVASLAIRSKDVRIESRVDGDSLFVYVTEAGSAEVSMRLDFAMIREAMACAAGFSGATELSDTTSPRLERFRAARLVPGKHMDASNYRIVSGSDDKLLKVEAQA